MWATTAERYSYTFAMHRAVQYVEHAATAEAPSHPAGSALYCSPRGLPGGTRRWGLITRKFIACCAC